MVGNSLNELDRAPETTRCGLDRKVCSPARCLDDHGNPAGSIRHKAVSCIPFAAGLRIIQLSPRSRMPIRHGIQSRQYLQMIKHVCTKARGPKAGGVNFGSQRPKRDVNAKRHSNPVNIM